MKIFSPLTGYIAAGVLLALGAALWIGDRNGAARVQERFDAYRAQIESQIEAEKARQRAEFAEAIALLQAQLAAEQAETADAEARADDLEAAILSRPPVPGRGATQEDVDALNR